MELHRRNVRHSPKDAYDEEDGVRLQTLAWGALDELQLTPEQILPISTAHMGLLGPHAPK